MGFTTPVFLIFFLPASLLLYFLVGSRYKNLVALAASLFFFAWGNLFYVPLMLVMVAVNFFLGKEIGRKRTIQDGSGGADAEARQRSYLLSGIVFNLGLLVFFKLLVAYGAGWLNLIVGRGVTGWLEQNPLPLGFSYIAFQMISYLMDVRNETCDSEKGFLDFALYVMLFPKIVVGPIARYSDLADQLKSREVSAPAIAQGARRFITGFAKKALIADTLAQVVNPAFALSAPDFSTATAWLALLGFTLQLYYDFSGYTDMAIGLGQMLGFRFVENFNYPYISQSISEFWRRWHISLSGWFRDYVFYPLERTRRRADRLRQILHMLVVFLLTGFWHGLTLTFLIWGLIHGAAIAGEMAGFGRALKKAWRPLQHLYTLAVLMLGWVFFRSSTPQYALQFLARLFGWQGGISPAAFSVTSLAPVIQISVALALVFALVFSFPVLPALQQAGERLIRRGVPASQPLFSAADLALLLVFVSSITVAFTRPYLASIYSGF